MPTNKRIIMAKMGLDAHDNGLRIVSKWLADAGYEAPGARHGGSRTSR